jgi:hypothetical protein
MTTDNKTPTVDVLAVMLDDAQKAKRHRMTVDAEYADDAEEESEAARAAVAELIEATEGTVKSLKVARSAVASEILRTGNSLDFLQELLDGRIEVLGFYLSRVKGESA